MSAIEADETGLVMACSKCGQRNRLKYERLGQSGRCGKCGATLSDPAEPIDVANESAFDSLTSRTALPILVDFWAPWCGPCRMVAPELQKFAQQGAGLWLVVKVNTQQAPTLAGRFRITAIPTMVLFKDGAEVARQLGAMGAPAIHKFLESHLAASPLSR